MEVDQRAIIAGVDTGLIRSLRLLAGFQVPNEGVRSQVLSIIVPELSSAMTPRPWKFRGQFTYAELAAMAFAARSQHNEQPLSKDDARTFIGPLDRFLNSWLCD